MLGQIKAFIIGRCSPFTIIINGTLSIFHNNSIGNYNSYQSAQKVNYSSDNDCKYPGTMI